MVFVSKLLLNYSTSNSCNIISEIVDSQIFCDLAIIRNSIVSKKHRLYDVRTYNNQFVLLPSLILLFNVIKFAWQPRVATFITERNWNYQLLVLHHRFQDNHVLCKFQYTIDTNFKVLNNSICYGGFRIFFFFLQFHSS